MTDYKCPFCEEPVKVETSPQRRYGWCKRCMRVVEVVPTQGAPSVSPASEDASSISGHAQTSTPEQEHPDAPLATQSAHSDQMPGIAASPPAEAPEEEPPPPGLPRGWIVASLARARRSERRMSEIAERLERDRYELLDLSRALRGQPPAHEDNQAEEPPCRLEPEPEPEFPSDTGDTDAESTHRIPEPGEDHPSVCRR